MTVPLRAALYLRVSTVRQAEHDISIPDQRRQGEAYCTARGYQLVETYVEPGSTATNDRRPEFQRMIEAGTVKPAPFDIVLVHSFSRFFRDHFELEFYVRKLAKNGIKLVSITQEIGDDPMHVMMRQMMALFDEYQSKENGKHTLRAMKENARQGFWNGSRPPIGYRVVAAEQRGAKVKKKLEIDPLHADTVRLIYRLALEGDGTSGPMGVKNITTYLNARRIFTRDGGRWGIGQLHRVLTRTTYIGHHEFNKSSPKSGQKPAGEVVTAEVPPLIDQATFDAVQAHLRARNPRVTPARVVSGPTLLTGICFCAACGGAMTLRTGKGGRYRYYTCSIKARQGATGCKGRSIPMEKLDDLVAGHIADRLLQPERLEEVLASVLDRRQERAERRREHIAELNQRAAEADLRLKRLYDAIESGVADLDDPALRDRIAGLKSTRDQAHTDAGRAAAALQSAGQQTITPAMVRTFAATARERIRIAGSGYRREHLRALAQRVEVADSEVRIMGSKNDLLRTLAAASSVKSAAFGVRSSVPKWRPVRDSNPCYQRERAAGPEFSDHVCPISSRAKAGIRPMRSIPVYACLTASSGIYWPRVGHGGGGWLGRCGTQISKPGRREPGSSQAESRTGGRSSRGFTSGIARARPPGHGSCECTSAGNSPIAWKRSALPMTRSMPTALPFSHLRRRRRTRGSGSLRPSASPLACRPRPAPTPCASALPII